MKPLQSLLPIMLVVCLLAVNIPTSAYAQESMDEADDGAMMAPAAPSATNEALPAVPRVPIRQPASGSMMASPPYGNAPLNVGFFVLANDPENMGFLTYQWNFGDGTVSSLPPEMYIFHRYKNPGNYVCTLIAKTPDGRSVTFVQGILVKPPQD